MKLSKLFRRCAEGKYIQVEKAASYAIERDGDTLYIYFECSNGRADWRNNLDFPAKAYRRGHTVWFAHRGFLRVWKAVEPYLSSVILGGNFKKIVITGYSHGAALAVFCHEYIWYHRPDLRESLAGYGFGCPRVLWGFRSAEIRRRWESFTVVRNLNDPVTHLPPALFGYFHVGTMLTVGEKGAYSGFDAHRPENIQRELLRYEQSTL